MTNLSTQKYDNNQTEAMLTMVDEYLEILEYLNHPEMEAKTVVIYYEDLIDAKGTLPQSLVDLWHLENAGSSLERIERLQKIAQSCDEFDFSCEHAACRHFSALQVTLLKKKHLRILSIQQMQKYFVLNTFEDCIRGVDGC